MIKLMKKKKPLQQEQSGLIFSSITERAKAENRGKRKKPMRREDKTVGSEEVKREAMRKG